MHTPLPWGQHPAYRDAGAYKFHHDGQDLLAFEITIASGDKLIGELRMSTGTGGHAKVDNEQEVRDNAELLFRAVNSHEALLTAVKALLGAETPQETLEASVLAVEAIKKAGAE